MIIEFMKLLVWVRRMIHTQTIKFIIGTSLTLLISTILGILADIYLPWENTFWAMVIRCLLAIIIGMSLSFIVYGINNKYLSRSEGFNFDGGIRVNYTLNQRINISIIIFLLTILIHLLFVKPGITLYTFGTSLIIFVGFFLLVFVRPIRDEFIKAKYGIEDSRDVEHDLMIEKIKENNERQDNTEES